MKNLTTYFYEPSFIKLIRFLKVTKINMQVKKALGVAAYIIVYSVYMHKNKKK